MNGVTMNDYLLKKVKKGKQGTCASCSAQEKGSRELRKQDVGCTHEG